MPDEYEETDSKLEEVMAALKYVVSWSLLRMGTKGGLYLQLWTAYQLIPSNQGCIKISEIPYINEVIRSFPNGELGPSWKVPTRDLRMILIN